MATVLPETRVHPGNVGPGLVNTNGLTAPHEVHSQVPPVQLVQTDPGAGKSRAARHHAARVLREMRAAGDSRTIVFAVPTHRLSVVAAEAFRTLAVDMGPKQTVEVWRGRNAENPDQPGKPMCVNLDAVREAQALMLDAKKYACEHWRFRETCAYLAQDLKSANLWIVTHQLFFERKPRAVGKLAAVVVDESPIAAALDAGGRSLPLSVLYWVDGVVDDPSGIATDRLNFLRRLAADALAELPRRADFSIGNVRKRPYGGIRT
jgi:hypothetical protein